MLMETMEKDSPAVYLNVDTEKAASTKTSILEKVDDLWSNIFQSRADRQRRTSHLSVEALRTRYESYEKLPGFEVLQKVHKVAPKLIRYRPEKPLSTLFRFAGTGVESVLCRIDFWLLMVIHITLSVVYHYNQLKYTESKYPEEANRWPQVGLPVIALAGSLLTFILTFYLNQTFSRYFAQFTSVNGANGSLNEIMFLVRAHFPNDAGPNTRMIRHNMCKLCIAVHFLAYGNLPWNRETKVNEWVWWYLERNKILTPAQATYIRSKVSIGTGNYAHKELLIWMERSVWAGESRKYLAAPNANTITASIIKLRGQLDGFYSFPSGTLPFEYFSLLNCVVTVYLAILAYAMVFVAKYWSILGYYFLLICFLGTLEIGSAMSNPLGSDTVDIPVFHTAQTFFEAQIQLIDEHAEYPDEPMAIKPRKPTVLTDESIVDEEYDYLTHVR